MEDKVAKLLAARTTCGHELRSIHQSIDEALAKGSRKVRFERLFSKGRDLIQAASAKNDQLNQLASAASGAKDQIVRLGSIRGSMILNTRTNDPQYED